MGLKKLKNGFAESLAEFHTLLQHMYSFPPVDVRFFQELFTAKATIEEEVVTLNQVLKQNADKQADIKRAMQDIATAREWKQQMAKYETKTDEEEWVKVPNEDGT